MKSSPSPVKLSASFVEELTERLLWTRQVRPSFCHEGQYFEQWSSCCSLKQSCLSIYQQKCLNFCSPIQATHHGNTIYAHGLRLFLSCWRFALGCTKLISWWDVLNISMKQVFFQSFMISSSYGNGPSCYFLYIIDLCKFSLIDETVCLHFCGFSFLENITKYPLEKKYLMNHG